MAIGEHVLYKRKEFKGVEVSREDRVALKVLEGKSVCKKCGKMEDELEGPCSKESNDDMDFMN